MFIFNVLLCFYLWIKGFSRFLRLFFILKELSINLPLLIVCFFSFGENRGLFVFELTAGEGILFAIFLSEKTKMYQNKTNEEIFQHI